MKNNDINYTYTFAHSTISILQKELFPLVKKSLLNVHILCKKRYYESVASVTSSSKAYFIHKKIGVLRIIPKSYLMFPVLPFLMASSEVVQPRKKKQEKLPHY